MDNRRFFRGKNEDSVYMTSAEREQRKARKAKNRNLILTVLIIAVCLVYSIFHQSGEITAVMNDESFCLVALEDQRLILQLTDIDRVELYDNLSEFDRGTLQSGLENSSAYSGVYINDAFGEYQLHTNTKVDNYVIVSYRDGILVFNTNTAEGTIELYGNMLSAISG